MDKDELRFVIRNNNFNYGFIDTCAVVGLSMPSANWKSQLSTVRIVVSVECGVGVNPPPPTSSNLRSRKQ